MRNRTEPAEPNRTEPNRLILEPDGTGLGNEPNRTGPSHKVSKKRRPNRAEPGKSIFRTKPNRTDEFSKKSPEPKRIEPKRFFPDLPVSVQKTLLRRRRRAFRAPKSGGGERFLLLDCDPKARVKGAFFRRHRYGRLSKVHVLNVFPDPGALDSCTQTVPGKNVGFTTV